MTCGPATATPPLTGSTVSESRHSGERPPHPRSGIGKGGRRMGRPPRIDRAAIAAAAAEIPLEELTLRAVAERLGVSVPGLYHHVSGKEDLFRLAAEQAALRLTMPVDRDQHWAVWFYEWAAYIRRAFVEDPVLLQHLMDGALPMDIMARHIDTTIGICLRQGFSAAEAMRANELVSSCALGSALTQIRDDRTTAAGHPDDLELRRMLARGDKTIPHLETMLDQPALLRPSPFHEQITTVLAGIAHIRGEAFADIAPLLPSAPSEQP